MATSTKPTKKSSAKFAPAAAADIIDDQLARYREMRHFDVTAEPSGSHKTQKKSTTGRGLPFVIQKHAASHLHYDFRLGWNGVLKSWAVSKGPSFSTKDRRLAVQVEDHPMEYGGFEGIIPAGQYGGGTVMVWDQGTWWPQLGHENVDAGLRDGSLKFEMNGTKMKGKWTLVRMGPKPGSSSNSTSSAGNRWSSSNKPQWLLIKEHDSFERAPDATPMTEEKPVSAVTGRTLEQIANQEDHVWNSKETAKPGQPWFRKSSGQELETKGSTPKARSSKPATGKAKPESARKSSALDAEAKALLATCPKEPQPAFLSPQLALEATAPPTGEGWLHELKLDGYRIQARKSGSDPGQQGAVQLLTRKGLDWAHRMPVITRAVAHLAPHDVTLDGEVVVLAADGNSSFADLQASFNDAANHPLTYFIFDLLHLDGRNTRGLPLRDRKHLLAQILPAPAHNGEIGDATLRLSEHIETDGAAMFHHACELHAEGIISKRADAPYRSDRGSVWLKSKCLREQEFVIAGFTLSSEGTDRIGSLLLGYYEASNSTPDSISKLIYAGRTGTGFTQKLKRDLLTQLSKIQTDKATFDRIPAAARRDAHWVQPKLVAQVRFATWTADNLVRQAAFLGLREDKPATEVVREEPTIAPRPKAGKSAKSHPEPANAASHRSQPIHAAKAQVQPKAAHPAAVPRPTAPLGHIPTSTKPKQSADSPRATRLAPAQSSWADIRLTHPNKILDPETGLTKRQLADYYLAVADRILPHIAGRPLSLVRCPEGAGKPCFFQKHVTAMLPPGISSVTVTDKKSGKPEPYITLDPEKTTPEVLAGFAQMGVLEVHPWSSTNADLEHPDRLIFDLDPDESLPWPTITAAAAEVRSRLKKAGLESFLKLTGGKGLHIVAPIGSPHQESTLDWTTVKNTAHKFVLGMERDNPKLYLTKMTKSARAGKIYLDYLRNERGATAVAPYSPRARLGAHVSLPLPWSALKETARPVFAVHDFDQWRNRLRSDPWKAMLSLTQQLDPAKF
jgi:bifunctional non-homologous end joining protein LigD